MQEIIIFITTSPIPTNPSTEIIDNTIASVRHFLPHSLIVIAADGVRQQQDYLADDYEEYKDNLRQNINSGKYGSCRLIEASEHVHQTGLLRLSLPYINTKYMFWVEHDTPMLTDRPIDFGNILKALDSFDYVMFFHLSRIPDGWQDMMYGETHVDGTRYLVTRHWSSRTNIATTDYYKKCLSYYSPESKAMFESKIYQIVDNAYLQNSGLKYEHKLLIYAPEDDLAYSGHYDGRGQEPTFNELQIF